MQQNSFFKPPEIDDPTLLHLVSQFDEDSELKKDYINDFFMELILLIEESKDYRVLSRTLFIILSYNCSKRQKSITSEWGWRLMTRNVLLF